MTTTSPEQNRALVLKAFDTLFNKRDYAEAERFWSQGYIQHSAHIPPGRDGLFNLVRGLPDTLRYENHVILAEGDYVIAHGRFSGHGRPRSCIAADIVRFEARQTRRALGRSSGRGDPGGIPYRSPDVRGRLPDLSA
jgi:predicted SnoaL-like aldol condensation-catalyzing enzyme